MYNYTPFITFQFRLFADIIHCSLRFNLQIFKVQLLHRFLRICPRRAAPR